MVVAGGSGRRFGGLKQFATVGDRPLVSWSIAAARSISEGVVVVVPAQAHHAATGWTDALVDADAVVTGGATRAGSVRAGLAAVPDEAAVVLVHDGARPLATPDLFRAVLDALEDADGAVPVVPVADTLRRRAGAALADAVDRTGLVAVQTPQGFRAGILRRAHAGDPEATDDAALVERVGGSVVVVPGEPTNLKVTSPDDLAIVSALLAVVR
ncbi:MAG: 2-C-methyl-D-erythritol 4-phosphate cytidylyltransferase [Acidimicrobiales bacterium]